MAHNISENVWRILMCPSCGGPLNRRNAGAMCEGCQLEYGSTESGAFDFRLRKPKRYVHELRLGTQSLPETDLKFEVLRDCIAPEVDFSGFNVPHHLTSEMMTHFPRAKTARSLMLDLGCGNAVHRDISEHAGFEYVGLDYTSDKATLLGDAHSLPFADESFEFILSIAVLEHIRFPFVMMREAYRVLQAGGLFMGTVAFLEPFHGNSYYHHSHLGTYNSLQEGGFKVEHVCPSKHWSVLVAQANMGLFPRMPRAISKSLVMPLLLFHKLWWRMGRILNSKISEETRITATTGAFVFLARR